MARKKTVQATTDVNNDDIVDELDTIEVENTEPKVFGWVAGKPVAEQVHPNNK